MREIEQLDSAIGVLDANRLSAPLDPPGSSWEFNELPPPESLGRAVWRAVVYADIFDFPLTRGEVHSYLQVRASKPLVDRAIRHAIESDGGIEGEEEFVFLRGRRDIVRLRKERRGVALSTWPRARRYARLLWAIPFVRMVAVTGSLGADNMEADHDIDVLLVTEPERLWLARGLAILVVRFARLRGDRLCPNYLISTRALHFKRHDLYTAHEVVQMVPLHGLQVAERLWRENQWYSRFLPQAPRTPPPGITDALPLPLRMFKQIGERVLALPPGAALERWERKRKIARLSSDALFGNEAVYTGDVCKGHCHGHGTRVARAFTARLHAQ